MAANAARYWPWGSNYQNFNYLLLGPFTDADLEFVDTTLAGVFLLQPMSVQRQLLTGLPAQLRALVYARAAQSVTGMVERRGYCSMLELMTWEALVRRMLEELGYTVVYEI